MILNVFVSYLGFMFSCIIAYRLLEIIGLIGNGTVK